MTAPDDFALRHALKALRQDRPPINDLWSGIEARLSILPAGRREPARRAIQHRWWTGALAACVLLAAGLIVAPSLNRAPGDRPWLVETRDDDDSVHTLLAAYTDILAAEQALGTRWADQLAVPGGADRIAATRELDASLTQLAAALRLEPQSQLLRRLMHQTLQQRAALTLDALDA